jgi:DNA-binding transcriptional regulator GbsR (MarR family)
MKIDIVLRYIGFYFEVRQINERVDTSMLLNNIKLRFQFNLLMISNHKFLLLSSLDSDYSIENLLKAKEQIRNLFGLDVLFKYERLSKYERQSLVRKRISFVVPNRNIYINELALHFDEREERRINTKDKLSLGAQNILLYILVIKKESISSSELQVDLKVNKMYVSRAVNELADYHLISITNEFGISRIRLSDTKVNIWQKAMQIMQNPIMDIVHIYSEGFQKISGAFTKSGMHELSRISMLQDDERVYAIDSSKWKMLKNEFEETYDGNFDAIKIEIWKSKIPMYINHINPLALYFSINDGIAERTFEEYENVLSEVLGGYVKW